MFKHQWAQPGLHELMKELRAVLDEYPGDRMLVGEDDDIAYLGNGDDELHLVFNFPLMRTDRMTPGAYPAQPGGAPGSARRAARARLALQHAGQPRLLARLHPLRRRSQHDAAAGPRCTLALVLTLKGTPFLYNGEEIGMTDLIITDPGKLRDTMATWYYDSAGQRPEGRSGRSRARARAQ